MLGWSRYSGICRWTLLRRMAAIRVNNLRPLVVGDLTVRPSDTGISFLVRTYIKDVDDFLFRCAIVRSWNRLRFVPAIETTRYLFVTCLISLAILSTQLPMLHLASHIDT
jgi:hypothetical protein